ncbi:MAG: terpene cyclase/mutase family protein [Planctomycetes bacterium]|nr:terpene cyclase/mutase family protein [Planctomycetota bacterium]
MPSFHDTMAEQLQHAPWLFVSAVGHLVLLLLLWLLMPIERAATETAAVAVAPTTIEAAPLPPPPPEPPRVQPDEVQPTVTPDEAPVASDDAAAPANDAADAPAPDAGANIVGLLPVSRTGPVGVPGLPGGRGNGIGRRGGPQPQIDRALTWLVRHQDPDGKWDCDGFMKHDTTGAPCDGAGNAVHDVGVTGLALLALLGDGNTLRSGRYRDQVRAATMWLRAQQQANGCFGPAAASDFVYDHAIAAYAMCEAYGLSAYELLRPVAQRGIDYLQQHRNPYGAWRYQPRDGDNDTSITGWCILALCSGRHFGLTVDGNALQVATTFLESCTSADGHVGYQRAGQPSARKIGDHAQRFPPQRTDALTAVGLFCRVFLGQDPKEHPSMLAAGQRLRRSLPRWDVAAGTIDFYYWYYGTYALFQLGGPAWTEWSKALVPAVVKTQREGGNEHGSWDSIDAWGEDGGRVYSTAILALTLQAHYRYGRLAGR